jgi:hypothetical protein
MYESGGRAWSRCLVGEKKMIQPQSYLKAAYPPPLRKSVAMVPRLFILSWDNHKLTHKRRDNNWQEAWGTLYPSGKITLENGMFYDSRSQMEAAYRQAGSHRIAFLDEAEASEA